MKNSQHKSKSILFIGHHHVHKKKRFHSCGKICTRNAWKITIYAVTNGRCRVVVSRQPSRGSLWPQGAMYHGIIALGCVANKKMTACAKLLIDVPSASLLKTGKREKNNVYFFDSVKKFFRRHVMYVNRRRQANGL